MEPLHLSQNSSSSSVPGTPPLPTLPVNFFEESVIPETPDKLHCFRDEECAPNPSNNIILPKPSNDKHFQNACLPLTHSAQAQAYLGNHIPINTTRSTETSLRVFCRFVADYHCQTASDQLEVDCICAQDNHCNHVTLVSLVRRTVFADGEYGYLKFGHSSWTSDQLKRVRFFLIEFVVNYKSTKTGGDVKPSTMKGYLMGLQRAFVSRWGYDINILEGPVFTCPKEGLLCVVDNKFSAQQARGEVTRSHNTLSREDLSALFSANCLSRNSPLGFQARLIFGIALITAMRPSALATLSTTQFRKVNLRGEHVWTVTGVIGSRIGASKTNFGGLSAVKDKPTEVCIWNRDALEGQLNLYRDIDDYMAIRATLECGTDRFFLAANPHGKSMGQYFKRQHLGRNSFSKVVREACKTVGVTGSGFADGMTAHGLRGTVVSLLFEDGCGDASVALRTGHRDLRSLKSYHNLRGNLGLQQQNAIFANEAKRPRIDRGGGPMNKENVAQIGDVGEAKLRRGTASTVDGLLSGVESITGGTFTFNVHNHYR